MSTVYPGALDSFTTKVDNIDSVMSAHVNNLQDSVIALETLVGVNSSSVNTTIQYQLANSFYPARSGDLMLTSSVSVPTGWTDVSSTYNNNFIRISSGTALNTGGADTHSHTGTATGTTDGHQLTTAEMPSHTHTWLSGGGGGGHGAVGQNSTSFSGDVTGSTGGDGVHSHTFTSGTFTTSTSNNIPVYVQTLMYKKS